LRSHDADVTCCSGKRLIVRGGRYNPEFRITVPERFGAER
jgi:hypothetical protein